MADLIVNLTRDDLDGGWVAECLNSPGCMGQGETEAEALSSLADAMSDIEELHTRVRRQSVG